MEEFRLHEWPVTNAMYELFDPEHKKNRWKNEYNDKVHPLRKKTGRKGEAYCPVVNVSWYDAWCFAAWCGCRLPSDLEWEHACRAGTATRWFCGNDEAELSKYAWYDKDWQSGSTCPVENLDPNPNGLYHMHGNVWEWCEDRYEPGASARVLRGGGWYGGARGCRSADRIRFGPGHRSRHDGFRLAAVPVGAKSGQVRAQAT